MGVWRLDSELSMGVWWLDSDEHDNIVAINEVTKQLKWTCSCQ